MTSSLETNSSHQLNITCTSDSGNRVWLLCFVVTFVVGLVVNVLVAYTTSRWRLLQNRLRHFRSLGDALVGQFVSGALSCCCGIVIILTTLATASCQFTPEVVCRAGAALPQLVLSSATSVTVMFVFSHCDSVTFCRYLQKVSSTVRKVSPVMIGLTMAAFAFGESSAESWLNSGCTVDTEATYRLPTVLAAVCFIACTAGTILVLSSHMALRRPTDRTTEMLSVPLMELNTADEDGAGTGGHVTSGDVTAAQQTCRISCEAVAVSSRQDADDARSWRCSSKMGLFTTTTTIIIIITTTTTSSSSSNVFMSVVSKLHYYIIKSI